MDSGRESYTPPATAAWRRGAPFILGLATRSSQQIGDSVRMDSLSQIVLGAAVCGLVTRAPLRRAMLYGAALGTLPDLDVFVLGHLDPVQQFTQHRSFSHSLFVLSALSLPLAWLLRRLDRGLQPVTHLRWWLAVWLTLITHPLLDACTVYGTQLFWPLMPPPVSGAFVFIIDPLYTLPLLAACIWAWRKPLARNTSRTLIIGLLLGHGYLLLGWIGKQHVEDVVAAELRARELDVEAILATPAPFTTLLWRVLVRTPDGHAEAWYSLMRSDPAQLELVEISRDRALRTEAAPLETLQTLRWFSHDWLKLEIEGDYLRVADLRMGADPDYFFAFDIARRAGKDWQPMVPARVLMERPRGERLGEIVERL